MTEDLLAYQFDHQGSWHVNLIEWSTPDKNIGNEQFWDVLNQCLLRLPKRSQTCYFYVL